jgi:hypothetical protein
MQSSGLNKAGSTASLACIRNTRKNQKYIKVQHKNSKKLYEKTKLSYREIWCEGKLLLKTCVLVMASFCNMVEVLTPYAHHLIVQALTGLQ